MGFKIIATKGTSEILEKHNIKCFSVLKISEGRPNVLDMMKNGEINLIINTPEGSNARSDGYYLRTAAVMAEYSFNNYYFSGISSYTRHS